VRFHRYGKGPFQRQFPAQETVWVTAPLVPLPVYEQLLGAESLGSYFNAVIMRNSDYIPARKYNLHRESVGVVDLLAIRKDHSKPVGAARRGDALQIILIQVKGGAAARPTPEDAA
jgi:hypothetical protein